ncbi:MAG: LysE family translocator [Aestuariivirgaceae bacterium]
MSLELWIAFVIASSALLAVPGPTVMLVVSYALGRGRSTGWATVPGVALGDFTAMTASLLGAGAILAASATLFTILKYVGACYLIWLGIKLWRAEAKLDELEDAADGRSRAGMFWHSFIVTALNPKGIVFFIAFVPQFVDVTRPVLGQFMLLEATFVILAAINVAIWAALAGNLRARFKRPETLRLTNRIGGSFLIGAGLLTAAVRRNA